MAEKSGFFNSSNGDRKYNAEFFAEYFASFIGNGVFPNPSTNLQVIANGDMTVTVKAGLGWINGYYYKNDSDLIIPIEVADGVLNRIDRIVLQYNTVDRSITAKVKKGTFASSPVALALQRDADAYELGLADIYVGAGVTSIIQGNITDLRLSNDYCGIVTSTIEQVDLTTIFNQYQSWLTSKQTETQTDIDDMETQFYADWNNWFSGVQIELTGDVAGNLLSLINNHKIDYVAQPADGGISTGTATAYTVSCSNSSNNPSIFTDRMGVVFSCHINSGDSPTLKWGNLVAKPLVKPNGSAAVLKANGIYTARYNATTGNFILQGEGGEYGNVTAADVDSTKTFGTEFGVVQGTKDLSQLNEDNVKINVTIGGITGDKLKYNIGDYVPAPQVAQDHVMVTPAGTLSTSMQCGLIDDEGNFYIYHYSNSISKFNSNGTLQWTCSATGTPKDWCFDELGNILYTNSDSILKIDKNTGVKSTYMSAVTTYSLNGIIMSNGFIYVTDGGSSKVNLIKISGTTKVGTYPITNQASGTYYGHGICADSEGNVYVSATYDNHIYKFNHADNSVVQWSSMANTEAKGLTYDSVNNCIYAASGVLSKFAMDGTLVWQKTSAYYAYKVIADNHGHLYTTHRASSSSNFLEVVKLDTSGNEIFKYRTFLDYSVSTSDIAINNNGYVVVHDSNYVVAKVYMGVKIVS